MYGKIFESIYDGTLAEDWRALITFQQLIVLCDADGTVDMTPEAISRRTSIPLEHITVGLEILQTPDPFSRTPGDEGCRIKLLDEHRPWGWYIVNHNKYKTLLNANDVRTSNRERKRKQRAKQKELKSVTSGHDSSQLLQDCLSKSRYTDKDTNTNTNTDTKNNTSKSVSYFDDFWEIYPKKVEKKKARLIWQQRKFDSIKDIIISDVKNRIINDHKWKEKFIPNPTTYLDGDRWEDEISVHIETDWKALAEKHARAGESYAEFKARYIREQN